MIPISCVLSSTLMIIVLVIPSAATSNATTATKAVANVTMSTFIRTVAMNSASEKVEKPSAVTLFSGESLTFAS